MVVFLCLCVCVGCCSILLTTLLIEQTFALAMTWFWYSCYVCYMLCNGHAHGLPGPMVFNI